MQIEKLPVEKLIPYKLNAKKHPQEQIEGIKNSISRFGFTQPVVIDKEGVIIIGHGRVEAAKLAGLKQVPCVRRGDLTPQEVKALRLIDNRIAETGWDGQMLGVDLGGIDFDFTPFNITFDDLIPDPDPLDGLTDPDDVPETPLEPKSKLGDIYQLGSHRLMCGDSTKAQDVEKLLAGVKPHLMVTDPPYGVEYDADWCNRADRANGKSYGASAIGKVKNDDRADWRETWALFPGNIAYVWHFGLRAGIVGESLESCGFTLRSQIIWAKNNFAISRGDYHWMHEPCWYAVKGTGKWAGDRKQTTIWQIDKPMKSETGHSTQKPVECMRRPMENNSSPGQAVYDPFLGSGTTLIAAEQIGRACYGLELNPAYCDVIVKRWEDFTGKKAELLNG